MSAGYFDGDEWRDADRRREERGADAKGFSRATWLTLEMGFAWNPKSRVFENPALADELGVPSVVIDRSLILANVSARVFQRMVFSFVAECRRLAGQGKAAT